MIKTTTFTLDNGLRFVHNYDPATAMVAMTTLYNVGARDEDPSLTGMAHLFEHLMFGGSVNIPDFDGAIERAGGWNNAWTSNDFTCFYDIAPAVNIETLFWLESDRMLSLAFSPRSLQVQQQVVIEEFKQVSLNKPYGDLPHHLRALLYNHHPYRWPTIGLTPDHISRVTLDDVRQFFFSHYTPSNAVIAISGNVTLDRVRALADKWYASIPPRPVAPRSYAPEPPITSPRTLDITADVPQALIVKAFPMPAYAAPGYLPCDIITDILSAGRASRLYRDVIMTNPTITDADASIIGSEEPGFIMVTCRLADKSQAAIDHASHTIDHALDNLRARPVTDHELDRAKNRYDSNFTFSTLSYVNKSQQLALALMHGEDINLNVARYRAVTPRQILDAARRYLDPSSSATLIYHPK